MARLLPTCLTMCYTFFQAHCISAFQQYIQGCSSLDPPKFPLYVTLNPGTSEQLSQKWYQVPRVCNVSFSQP